MQQIVNVTIDESGRSRASAKSIGIQYETGVAKFLVTPAPSWVNDDYFYYLIISPPEDSGNEQYAVPLINKGGVFEYQIGSGITWHVGNYKFAFIAMSEQLSSDGRVPTTGIVSISEAWTCNIESGILRLNELDKQPTDPNFTLLYDDLMALSVAVESKGNYAKTQGDYAKNIGDELKVKQEIGAFNGTPGSDGTSAGFGTPSAIVTTLEDNEDATVKVTASGEDTAKVFNFEFGIPKGAKGDKGEPGTDGINGTNGNDGANGKGIASIIRTDGTGEPGTIDTYTITYTDNTTSTYEVYNGKDGINGENGSNGTDGTNGADGITPHIGENGNWWLGTVDTGVCAQASVVIDGKMSDTSENTVQNKVIKQYVDDTAGDILIPYYANFSELSEEEKTSVADKLLNCISAVKGLTKICYLNVMDGCLPLAGIVSSENYIEFVFIFVDGLAEKVVIYTVSTTSNTLINVTSNVYNLVDSAMSDTSTKPVQNKVVKSYVDKNVATLVDVGNIDWDEVTPNTKGYIANKPFGRVNTFANTTNILFENTTHTGGMHYENVVFNIDFPSGFAENIENIIMATLQYSGKTYNIRTTSSAPLKKTCTETKAYSKEFECTGEFNTESIVFELKLSKKVKRTDGTTTLAGTLTCNINDLIASGIVSEIPEDQTVNLTFGLKVTTAGTKIKVIDSAYLPIATENNIGAVKPGTGLTIDEQGSINVSVDSAMSDTSKNLVQNKVIKQYVDTAISNMPNITASATDLTAGTSALTTGEIYLVYE